MRQIQRKRMTTSVSWFTATMGLLVFSLFPLPSFASDQDPAEVHDLPGFGIWGPAYRLRNVQEGQRLVVRNEARRASATVGSLPRSASEILVLGCTPEIAPLVFEDASKEAKRELLGSAWCRVDHYGLTGYVPGVYLDPILDR